MSYPLQKLFRRTAVLGTLALLTVLALWPVKIDGLTGDDADADACQTKIHQLSDTLVRRQPARETFGEREINAHLHRILAHNDGARRARGLTVGIDDLRLATGPEGATLFARCRLTWIPFVLRLRATGVHDADDPRGPVRFASVRIGHLPLLPPLKEIVIDNLGAILSGLTFERRILSHLASLDTGDDHLTLGVAPAMVASGEAESGAEESGVVATVPESGVASP